MRISSNCWNKLLNVAKRTLHGAIRSMHKLIQFALLISCSGLKWQGQRKQAFFFFIFSLISGKATRIIPSKWIYTYVLYVIFTFNLCKIKMFPKHRRKSVLLKCALVTLAVSCTEFLKNTNRGIQCLSDFSVIFVTY